MIETATYPTCFILPPIVLARVAEEGGAHQREAALKTLATSAGMRARRTVAQQLVRTGASLAALRLAPPGERKTVYDVQNQGASALPGRKVRGEGDPPTDDPAVNEAYDGADHCYDFYMEAFERNSIDGEGLELVSSVHYGVDFDNAFWEGTQMVYGDGSGEFLARGSLTRDIAVIAHEMTHGVTQYTAGLKYSKQSGALNESFSDVMGSLAKQWLNKETVDQADWLVGEGILGPSMNGTALRSLKDPGTAFEFDDQPAHMDDYQDLPDDNDPRNDNGGVHINSGIPNKAFYVVTTTLGGHSWERAGKIWYDTLCSRLSAESQFTDAAEATIASARDLFGENSEEESAVESAWESVGVL